MSKKIIAKFLVTAAVCLCVMILILLGGCSGGDPHHVVQSVGGRLELIAYTEWAMPLARIAVAMK